MPEYIDDTEAKLDALDDILSQATIQNTSDYYQQTGDLDPLMLKHIFDHWGCFAQIVDANETLPETPSNPQSETLNSGLSMVDYGHAIAVSPGDALFNLSAREETAPTTLSECIKETAHELVARVKKRGWEGIHVIDGHPTLLSAILYSAAQQDVALYGYEDEEGYTERRFSYEYGESMPARADADADSSSDASSDSGTGATDNEIDNTEGEATLEIPLEIPPETE